MQLAASFMHGYYWYYTDSCLSFSLFINDTCTLKALIKCEKVFCTWKSFIASCEDYLHSLKLILPRMCYFHPFTTLEVEGSVWVAKENATNHCIECVLAGTCPKSCKMRSSSSKSWRVQEVMKPTSTPVEVNCNRHKSIFRKMVR